MTSEVRFPQMRAEVMYALAALADEAYQRAVWVEGTVPRQPYSYDFDAACHALLDDTVILERPDDMVGVVLENTDEVEVLSAVASAMQALLERTGKDAAFGDVRRYREAWSEVVRLANEALGVLGKPASFP